MLNTPRELCFSGGGVHASINSILAIYTHLRFVANGVKVFFLNLGFRYSAHSYLLTVMLHQV